MALGGRRAVGSRSSSTLGSNFLYVAVPIASAGNVYGAVRVTYPTTSVDTRVRRVSWALVGVALVVLTAVALAGYALARSVLRPLRGLGRATAALANGDLDARAPTDAGPPELRRLAAAFNDMAGRLSRLVNAQRSFVADASHQLRTPLTALRLRLENLEPAVSSDAADLHAAVAETGRLARVVDGLLANALRVAPVGSRILMAARRAGNRVELHVIDQGPGMTAEQRARAFDRFWRAGPPDAEGTGLGLAVVRQLVDASGGTAELRPAQGGGLDAVASLLPVDDTPPLAVRRPPRQAMISRRGR